MTTKVGLYYILAHLEYFNTQNGRPIAGDAVSKTGREHWVADLADFNANALKVAARDHFDTCNTLTGSALVMVFGSRGLMFYHGLLVQVPRRKSGLS